MKKLDLRMNETKEQLKEVCRGLRTIQESGLKTDLVVLMLQDMTSLNKTQVKEILYALPKMESRYLK